MIEIYVPAIGQYDNIGDVILRRRLIRWLQPLGRLHVFVGDSPAGYAEALGLADDDIVYRSFAAFYRDAVRDALRGRASYVFKPGEIQITLAGLKEHVSLVPLQLLVRARGGAVIRVGAGSRGFRPLARALMLPSLSLTDLTVWRDHRTARFLGTGGVGPDLAFAEGSDHPRGDEERTLLVVSMRGDRPVPPDAWFDGVRAVAERRGLEVVAIVQVERDRLHSALLAERLGGRVHPWPDADHGGHELALRELYRHAAVVVSDRLHVLIAAVTEGAPAAAALVDASDKIDRHFRAASLPDVSLPIASRPADDVDRFVDAAVDDWPRFARGLETARAELEGIRASVERVLAQPPSRRRTVWHLGRRGDVAGGMTQVVNAFIAWPFEASRVRLLTTRDGTTGPKAVLLYLGALARLPFLGARRSTVVAVHLSQGGSFVREGSLERFAALLGYRTVVHLHGSSFVDYAERHPARVAGVLSRADAIVALSAETRDAVLRLVPTARVEIVPNAVPTGTTRGKERMVVFGGSVGRRKGVDVLVEAWRLLGPVDGWTLHIAGPLAEPDVVVDAPEGVVVHGALPHDALLALLERSAIAVLPSRDEAMPMFVLEALARRNAVIASEVGGVPSLLDGGAGALVPPGDIAALAAALRRIVDDDAARAALADAGYARFDEQFSARSVYPRVEGLWLSVLS
ncbi:glycosyltransferase [Microbacterium sp. NPDC055683]